MIRYVNDDLVDSGMRYIAHGVNCRGVMGKGVALDIRTRWPDVFTKYRAHVKRWSPEDLLGTTFPVQINPNKIIFNMFTQDNYGNGARYVNYEAVYTAFESTIHRIELADPHHRVIGIPAIGAGNAGGDWDILEAIFRGLAVKHNFDVNVYRKIQ